MIAEEARRLHLEGRTLYLCSLKGEVLEVLKRGGCIGRVGGENLFPSKSEAVRTLVLSRLDPERCRVCRVRIFSECDRMPGISAFDDQYRAGCVADHLLRDAAHQQAVQAGAAVRAGDDQPGLALAGDAGHDFVDRALERGNGCRGRPAASAFVLTAAT